MVIPKMILNDMVNHCKEEAPLEACGYLAGKDGVVTDNYRMTNVDRRPDHYSFDPTEQIEILKESREGDFELIGVYHSHPASPAIPSAEDVRLAYDPSISYVIISLATKVVEIKSYKIKNKIVTPEAVEIL